MFTVDNIKADTQLLLELCGYYLNSIQTIITMILSCIFHTILYPLYSVSINIQWIIKVDNDLIA